LSPGKINPVLVCALFLLFQGQGPLFPEERSISDLISPDLFDELADADCVTEVHFNNFELNMMPNDAQLKKTISDSIKEVNPSIIIEGASLYKKPEGSGNWTPEEKTKLFNGIVALSSLQGLLYYSPSRKKPWLLYEISHIIESPKNKNALPDPVFNEKNLPASLTLYALQKDKTFGENIYKNDFTLYNHEIIVVQENRTRMFYKILPVLSPGSLRSVISIIDAGDYILIYMTSMADAISFPGLKARIGASFTARLEAILEWFKEKAGAVYN